MAPESSAVHQISSDEEGNLEDLPFDWLAELLDHIDNETDEAKGGTKDEIKAEAQESIDIVAAANASWTSPAVQKQNCIPSEGGKAVSADDSDDDCLILDADPDAPIPLEDDKTNGSDDLLIVSEKGPIACRDYPHPRHLCAKFPFSSTPHEKHCHLCHCYVCDSLAPCIYWGSGISNSDHCHSNDKEEIWKIQRKFSKEDGSTTPSIQKLLDVTLSTTPTPPILEPMTSIWVPPSINLVSQEAMFSRSFEPNSCSAICFERPNVMNHRHKPYSRPIHGGGRCAQYLNQQFTPGPLGVNKERQWYEAGNLDSQFIPSRARFRKAGSSIGAPATINSCIHCPANINQENIVQAGAHTPQIMHGDHSHLKMLREFLSSVELESSSFQGNCHSSNSSLTDMLLPAVSSQAQAHSHIPTGNYHSGNSFTDMLLSAVSSQTEAQGYLPTRQAASFNMHGSGNPVAKYPDTGRLDVSMSYHPLALDLQLPSLQPSGSAFMHTDSQQLPVKPEYLEFNLSSLMHDIENQPSEDPSDLDLSLTWPPSSYRSQRQFQTGWEGHGQPSSCSSFRVGSQLQGGGVGNIQHQL